MSVIALDFYSEDDPNGTLLGTLDDADCKKIEIRPALHELGAGQFTVSRHHPSATSALLTENNIVKVRIPSVSAEPIFAFILKDGDFVLIDSNDEQGGEDLTFGGPGLLYLYNYMRLPTTPFAPDQPSRGSGDRDGIWWWINEPYGAILTRITEEGQNQPGAPLADVTINFTRTVDSDSVAWPNIDSEFQTPIGSGGLDVMERLAAAGNLYLIPDPDLTFHAYQSYGQNLVGAFGTDTVRFEKGVNILTKLVREVKAREVLTHLIQRDSKGAFSTEVSDTYSSGRAHYGYSEVSQTDDDTLLNAIAQQTIDISETQGQSLELEITPGFDPANGLYMPGPAGSNGHFWVGDHVTLHTGSGEHDFNESTQTVVAIRIVLADAADDADSDHAARSLHIVPELNYLEYRSFGAPNPSTIGTPGYCCGPSPAPEETPPTGGAELWSVDYTYADDSWVNPCDSSTGNFVGPWVQYLHGCTAMLGARGGTNFGGAWSSWIPASDEQLTLRLRIAKRGSVTPRLIVDYDDGGDCVTPGESGDEEILLGSVSYGFLDNCASNAWTDKVIILTPPAGTTMLRLKFDFDGAIQSASLTEAATVIDSGEHAIDFGSYPHDSPYYLPSDYVEARLDELQSLIGQTSPWYNVKVYGAEGDGTTDDTSAINAAIAAINSAGSGVLYFPAGTYLVSAGLTTIGVPTLIRGDGSNDYAGDSPISLIVCSSGTANLFTVTADMAKFVDIAFKNSVGTPSAGSAVSTQGSYLEQRVDFESVAVHNFYIGLDVQVGGQWSIRDCFIYNPVLYGIKIRNTVNDDAGDWAISDTEISTTAHAATAGIYAASSGGGKITNCKINVGYPASSKFTNGILVDVTSGASTVIFLVSQCSIENVTGDAIKVQSTGTGRWREMIFHGNQVGLWSNSSGYAINITPTNTDDVEDIIIANNIFQTDGSGRKAIRLAQTDNVVIVGNLVAGNFTTGYDSAGTVTNVTEIGAGVTDHGALTGLTDNDHPQYVTSALLTTRGDLFRRGAASVERVALGTSGQVLSSNGTDAVWADAAGNNKIVVDGGTPDYSGIPTIGLTSVWGIDGSGIPYYNAAGVTSGEEAALLWDPDTNQYVLRAFNF